MTSREDNVYMAKLSEQAERYDEMVEAVRSPQAIMCVSVLALLQNIVNRRLRTLEPTVGFEIHHQILTT